MGVRRTALLLLPCLAAGCHTEDIVATIVGTDTSGPTIDLDAGTARDVRTLDDATVLDAADAAADAAPADGGLPFCHGSGPPVVVGDTSCGGTIAQRTRVRMNSLVGCVGGRTH